MLRALFEQANTPRKKKPDADASSLCVGRLCERWQLPPASRQNLEPPSAPRTPSQPSIMMFTFEFYFLFSFWADFDRAIQYKIECPSSVHLVVRCGVRLFFLILCEQ